MVKSSSGYDIFGKLINIGLQEYLVIQVQGIEIIVEEDFEFIVEPFLSYGFGSTLGLPPR